MEGNGAVHLFRLIHILAGAFWVGAVVFVACFLLPSLRAVGPAAGPVMQQIAQVRKLPLVMMTAAILTILSGIALYWRDSAGFSGPWMHSGQGTVFGIGGVLAIVAAIFGMIFTSPNAKRMGALAAEMKGAGRPPTPEQVAEMQRLQERIGRFTTIVMVLVVLATAAMAVARYVP
ncbi:MAG: hypothetical protein ACREL3_02165 [Gemmatimonadales bacterium]